MEELHNKLQTKLVSKKGQRCLLCSNKKVCRCPFLEYIYVEDEESLNKTFDILFNELLLNEITHKDANITKADIGICTSINS